MTFVKATRQRVWLKMAVTGPSGSGKTFSALRLAFGLGKRVALIDTENGSGSLYAHLGDYDTLVIESPFTVQKYKSAIDEAVAAGYDVLIIDSLSHVWAGDGGLLDQKSARDARGGNGFTNWAEIGKVYEQFKTALLQSPIHIIGTMRSKQDYVIDQDSRGKSAPRKVGMAPIQRDGFEYEFTTVLDVDMTHTAATSKDRTGLFTDEVSQITEDHGRRLAAWLVGGSTPAIEPAARFAPPQERPQIQGPQIQERPQIQGPQIQERPQIQGPQSPERQQAPTPSNVGTPACTSCGKALTKAQQELSTRNYGAALCPGCQKENGQKNSGQKESEPKNGQKQESRAASSTDQTPWESAEQTLRGFELPQRTNCLARFQHAFGTRNIKALEEPQILEVLHYLDSGQWPYEADFQTAQTKARASQEQDPFEGDDFETLIGAETEILAGKAEIAKGHGDS